MAKGKLIVIEGTDCSGKETQTKLLISKLREKNIMVDNFSFPNYNSPTGKIIGGPYLGKNYICDSYFKEGPTHVDPKVASLYYAADRKYNIDKITFLLENGANIILDRYIYSNMAHQGGKIKHANERKKMYKWLEQLEFDLLELPKPDVKIFLYVPLEVSMKIRKNRKEIFDQHESNLDHLKHAEQAYLELVDLYNFIKIDCTIDNKMKSIEEINEEICKYLKKVL